MFCTFRKLKWPENNKVVMKQDFFIYSEHKDPGVKILQVTKVYRTASFTKQSTDLGTITSASVQSHFKCRSCQGISLHHTKIILTAWQYQRHQSWFKLQRQLTKQVYLSKYKITKLLNSTRFTTDFQSRMLYSCFSYWTRSLFHLNVRNILHICRVSSTPC